MVAGVDARRPKINRRCIKDPVSAGARGSSPSMTLSLKVQSSYAKKPNDVSNAGHAHVSLTRYLALLTRSDKD